MPCAALPALRRRRSPGVEGVIAVILGPLTDVLEQLVDHRAFGDHRDHLHLRSAPAAG